MAIEPASQRLDLWLAADRGISRHTARQLIDAGAVEVNGHLGRPSRLVSAGDTVIFTLPEPREPVLLTGPEVLLSVVHEDDAILVIDKPAGLVVHPAPGHPDGTVADGLRQRGSTWSLLGGEDRPGIVHRLDRDTSGLMVVAKTEAAHRSLSAQLSQRTLGRHYWALVDGVVDEDTGHIEAPVGRDPKDRKRMAIVDSGREAITDFAVTERLPRHTVLDVRLRTGRTHQIRVHLAYIGRPIVGDPLYGRRAERHAAHRLGLHARELHLNHPDDGRECSFTAPLPAELVELLASAREGLL